MLKAIPLLCLVAAATTSTVETIYPMNTFKFGSLGITHTNIRGKIFPITDAKSTLRTVIFRTEMEENVEDDLVNFRCTVLEGVYATISEIPTLLCRGDPIERNGAVERTVFLFAAEGLRPNNGEKDINLLLEKRVLMNMVVLPDSFLGTTILGDTA